MVNAGTGETNLGVETVTGSLWAAGSVVLRDRGKVEGDALAAGSITLHNGASVTGVRSPLRTDLRLLPLASFSVPFPTTSGPDVWLEPDRSRSLTPGNYGQLNVASRSKVILQSGTYFFASVNLEPQAELRFDSASGPVWLYVKSAFTYKGAFVDARGKHDRLMVGYFGTNTANIETPFSGTLVAPAARVELKTVSGAHRGSFCAKELEVHSRTRIEHHPFVAPWRGGLVAGDSWRASPQTEVESSGCACGIAGSATSSNGLAWLLLGGLGFAGFARLATRRRGLRAEG